MISVKGNAADPVTLKLTNLAINIQSLIPKKPGTTILNDLLSCQLTIKVVLSLSHRVKYNLQTFVSKFIFLLKDNTWLLKLWVVTYYKRASTVLTITEKYS
jgi:hypothetical protein